MLGTVAGVVGGDDGEVVAGLCVVDRIDQEGGLTRAAVDGEGSSFVVVIGFEAVGDRGGIGCGGGTDELIGAAVFINGRCGAA